ncbi:MAG TPA: hypothetical protein VME70_11415 [Mycobacteriales bacterium]|nr:hypothetical protein [Mycobacteriales bacterium]
MSTRVTHAATTPSRLAMPRSRGGFIGFLLILLGAWGALIPFFGHSFGYGFTPDNTWTWTAARGWLEVLPGGATFLGGLMLLGTAHRGMAMLGSWLAAAAGAWFVLGTVIAPLWSAGNIGTPIGSTDHAVLERIGMFTGLGLVIIFLAAAASGRASVSGVVTAAPVADPDVEVVQLPAYPEGTTEPQPATTGATTTGRRASSSWRKPTATTETIPSDPAYSANTTTNTTTQP